MKLHHLRNVVAIVERGSLRAAAKHLGLAQPAISRSVKELEQELGVILFERNRFGMTLTGAGDVFLRRAKGIQVELQRTLDEIEQFKGADRGSITLACSGATLLSLLPAIISRFHRRYPDIRLNVVEGTFPRLERDIRDGLIDLYYGPVGTGMNDPALTIDILFENARIIVGRKAHALQFATSLKELVGAAWVTTPVMADGDNEVNSVFKAAGLPMPLIRMHASSGMAVTAIVATSNLLAPLPIAVATEASALRSVVVMSAVLPNEAQTELRKMVRDYIQYTATTEWPFMAKGVVTLNASPPTLNNALKFTLSLPVVTPGQQTAQREVAESLEHALEVRRERILISRSEVNGVKWLCLAILAVCLLFAIAFVHCDNRLTSAVAIGLFSAALATTFLLILSHDRPFTGEVALSPEPLLQVMPDSR